VGPVREGGEPVSEPGFFSEVVEWFTDPFHWEGSFGIPARVVEHILLSAISVIIAAAVALPLGLYIGHRRRFEFLVVSVANLGRAIPSFGLLFLFVLWLGLGLEFPAYLRPAILLALVLLAVPPILTNTYVGIQGVDADALEAARGMGFTEGGVLFRIEIPIGAPLIVAGLRTAAVQVVATATLAAVIAGGGLGRYIVDGFATRDLPQIFAGALMVAILAVLTELAFSLLERVATPRTTSRGRKRRVEPVPWEHVAQAPRSGGELAPFDGAGSDGAGGA
jgi:osmoprotectant transport system permease protein